MLAILLVSLLAVSAVSAADNATSDIVSTEETTAEVVSVENDSQVIDSVDFESNLLSANSDGTFTDLANEIANANGELKLTKNYVYDSSRDSNYKNGIVIDKEITINGRGFIINGNHNARAFDISSGNVILRNIEFTNCSGSSYDGGAVYWNGINGILFDCNFINCYSSGYGGAVYWNGVNGSLYSCDFINCYSSHYKSSSSTSFNSETSSSNFGGAVYWNGDYGSLFDCSFRYCKSYNSNYDSNEYSATYTLTDSSHSSSSSSSSGGAIYWNGAKGSLFNCDFIDCYSESYSSSSSIITKQSSSKSTKASAYSYSYNGVYWWGDNGNLFDCNFINSTSSYSYEDCVYTSSFPGITSKIKSVSASRSYSYGGAVYWYGIDGNLFDCNFINPYPSSSTGSGDGSGGGSSTPYSYGGAVYWYGVNGNLFDSSFKNCNVNRYNGYANAIYWNGGDGNLLNCSFIDCYGHSSDYDSYYDGSVYWNGIDGNMFKCSFDGNYYDYEKYCKSGKSICPSLLINTHSLENNDRIVTFDSTQLVNNISITLYNVTDRKVLYNKFDISSEELISSLNLNNLEEGEYQIVLEYAGDKFYSATSVNDLFKIGKNSSFEVSINDVIDVGDNVTVNLTLNEDATGQVRITTSDYTCINELIDGKTSFNIPYEIGKTDEYKIKYVGDDKYNPIYITNPFTVLYKSDIILDLNDTYVFDESIPLIYNLTSDCTGTISVFVDDIFKANASVDELFELENIDVGEHNITVIYNGDKYYTTCSDSAALTITKADSSIAVNSYNLARDLIFEIALNEKATGDINVALNNKIYSGSLIEGKANITISNLVPKNYKATITYSGNDNYNPATTTAQVTVDKYDTYVSADDIAVYQGDVNGKLIATLTNDQGVPLSANILINLNGIDYTLKSNSKGQASVSTADLAPGKYTATITYKGNSKYAPSNTTAQVTVNKKLNTIVVSKDVTVYSGDANGKLIATLTNEDGVPLSANMVVTLNGVTYSQKSNSKGQISVSTADLNPGTYTATVTYKGNSKYAPSSTTAKVTVTNKLVSVVSAEDVTVRSGDANGKLIATLTNAEGVPLSANIVISLNNVNYAMKTNSKGQASVSTADLAPGEYTATITYKGNSKYNPSTTTAKVTVTNRLESVVSSEDVTVKCGDANGKLVATLTNAEGIPLSANIVISLNGVTYSMKTNSKGQATVSTADLAIGEYIATIIYKGNSKYAPSSTIAKITVNNKLVSVVSADDVTVKQGDANGKLVATLTNEEGVPLSANVVVTLNGVDYTLKSNSEGQVSVSTAGLEIGEYTATVTYKGNSKYNPSTTIAKVVVNNKLTSCISGVYNSKTQEVVGTLTNSAGVPLSANVVVNLNGVDYALKSNSKGQFKVSTADLAPGKYTAKLVYKGNSKYGPSSATVNVVIP